jgi:Zn-dependent protease
VLVKFSSIFIAIAAYALIFGWKFAVGFVLLIFIHELGHYIEAKREGLSPKLPVFIPFLGAYVQYTRGHPWQTVRVAIAGPILGGAAAAVCLAIAEHNGSRLFLRARVLRLLHQPVQPAAFRDLRRRRVWRSARWLRLGGGRGLALASYALYLERPRR